MEVIGFTPDEISSMLELLAAILNLGNATFSEYSLPNSIEACQMEKAECKYNSRCGHKFKYLLSLASYIGPPYFTLCAKRMVLLTRLSRRLK